MANCQNQMVSAYQNQMPQQANGFGLAANYSRAGEFQESRELSEIKGKMFLARQFPRDPEWAKQRVIAECQVPELAAAAQYEFKRGDSVVRGPSIRLVEVLARNWGNIDCGVKEIEASDGSTLIKTYAWDLETNVSDEKIFSVKHERSTKKGSYKLTDERDIYELVANKGARRKRACLLAVMPGWYVDAALKACDETLAQSLTDGRSFEETCRALVEAFGELGVTPPQIAEKIGKDVDKLTKQDAVRLRHLYSAIKDGFVKASDAFGFAPPESAALPSDSEAGALDALNAQLQIGGAQNV